jgi:hypothetical protein
LVVFGYFMYPCRTNNAMLWSVKSHVPFFRKRQVRLSHSEETLPRVPAVEVLCVPHVLADLRRHVLHHSHHSQARRQSLH